jgi:hypothetical protein
MTARLADLGAQLRSLTTRQRRQAMAAATLVVLIGGGLVLQPHPAGPAA